ncbi:MAG: chitobiase/beta-hexosaminidase C-terminal domain-containing protein [Gallintestinimicrobium sp.]
MYHDGCSVYYTMDKTEPTASSTTTKSHFGSGWIFHL